MNLSDVERTQAFGAQCAKAQATEVVDLAIGYAVLQADFPLSYQHNRIVVTSVATHAEMITAADEVLGEAGLTHRYVSVESPIADAVSKDFVTAGYECDVVATMIYTGAEVEPASHEVHAVSLEALRPALIRDWQVEIPDASDEALRQLADRTVLYERGCDVALLAVYDGEEIAARADLYLDRAGGIAQFENLMTGTDFRGRGYAGALLHEATMRSQRADTSLFFLTADVNDWPYQWYERFGFVEVDRSYHFTRAPDVA